MHTNKTNPYRGLKGPVGRQEFEAPRINRQPLHEGGKVVSPTHGLPLPQEKKPRCSYLFEAESTPGS